MTTDLFGDPAPVSEYDIVAGFIAFVRRRSRASFNQFRQYHGIGRVSCHSGALVRAACLRGGLVPAGTTSAKVPASHGRLRRVHVPCESPQARNGKHQWLCTACWQRMEDARRRETGGDE